MYRPEYERIKRETLEAKNKQPEEETGEMAGGSTLDKDSLIDFGDGLYKDLDSEEDDDPLEEEEPTKRQSKRTIKTIPEEDEEGKEPLGELE